MSSDDVLKQVISEASFDAASILERANSNEYKQTLRRHTQEAKEAGLCGVPSYRVSRRKARQDWQQAGSVVWGQDELPVVEDLIAGWHEGGASVAGVHNAERSRL